MLGLVVLVVVLVVVVVVVVVVVLRSSSSSSSGSSGSSCSSSSEEVTVADMTHFCCDLGIGSSLPEVSTIVVPVLPMFVFFKPRFPFAMISRQVSLHDAALSSCAYL